MSNVDHIVKLGLELFEKRGGLLSLWQEIAENFYPERADFTQVRNLGAEFGSNLSTSYTVLARRDLGNAFGSMLRPSSKNWKHVRTPNYHELGHEGKAWLEWADTTMTRHMYSRKSQFVRSTKEGDHDFAAFGQTVIQTSLNRQADGVLYRCYHLRDVAWVEDETGVITTVFRKWNAKLIDLNRIFKGNLHPNWKNRLEKEPYFEIQVWHVMLPSDQCDGMYKTPFVSYFIDVANKHVMEETGSWIMEYVIPRWQTIAGSQYAYSPATITALPEARLIQAMTHVLLEAGEKATNPPMLAVQEALRSDISIYAGGVTWVDADYDERLGEVLRPLSQDSRGIPLGIEMARDTKAIIAEAFFLNKIGLPSPGSEMTAYEVGQRVQEYIRQALPLFEPMEPEYNGPLCENTFQLMLRAGFLGSVDSIPKELQGLDYSFAFESPLHDAIEREKGQRFQEAKAMLADAIALDESSANLFDVKLALRDVLNGIGVPMKWTRSPEDVQRMDEERQQAMQQQQTLQNMQTAAQVGKTAAEAGSIGANIPNNADMLGGLGL